MHLINANALRTQIAREMVICKYKGNEEIYGIVEKAIENCEQFGIDSLNPRVHSLSASSAS